MYQHLSWLMMMMMMIQLTASYIHFFVVIMFPLPNTGVSVCESCYDGDTVKHKIVLGLGINGTVLKF